MSQSAVQRQLTDEGRAVQAVQRHLLRRRQYAHGDRQVIGGTAFGQIGRRQVDRIIAHGEAQAAVADGRAHAHPRLLHGSVRQTHHDEIGHPPALVDFDFDDAAVKAKHGAGVDFGQHRLIRSEREDRCLRMGAQVKRRPVSWRQTQKVA